jgi:cyclic beta-1,2-glucan synthetase
MANRCSAPCSEAGSGCCWYGNSQSNRLTPWSNDPVSDPATEAIYIRDEDSGVFWTPTPLPVRELDAYRARHGQGYTESEHKSGLEQHWHCAGTDSRETIRTAGANQKQIVAVAAVVCYCIFRVVLARSRTSQMHVACSWDESAKALFARNPYHRDYGRRAFAAIARNHTYTSDARNFGRTARPTPAACGAYRFRIVQVSA